MQYPEKQTISETTGPQKLAEMLPSVTGERRGATGAVALPTTSEGADREPWAVNMALVATLTHTSPPLRLQPKLNRDFDVIGFDLDCEPAQAIPLLPAIRDAMRPAAPQVIAKALAECDAAFPGQRNEAQAQMRVKAFIEDLAEFPPDIVTDAFKRYRRAEEWPPKPSQIRDYCQPDYQRRRALYLAVKGKVNAKQS